MPEAMSTRSSKPLAGSSRSDRPNIGILLRRLSQDVVQRVSDGLVEAGFDDVRPAHTAVFQHIEGDGSRLTDLAERAQITKQSMGYLVDYLEERGYLERRPDPADRRARRIVATTRGRDLLDGLGKRLREAEDQVLAGLDEAGDRQAFRTLLQHLSLYAATALDSTSADPCTTPAPEDC